MFIITCETCIKKNTCQYVQPLKEYVSNIKEDTTDTKVIAPNCHEEK